MSIIRYPKPLQIGDQIAVTAPSSGVEKEIHHFLLESRIRLTQAGYNIHEGKTIWNQYKSASAPKEVRANELMDYLTDPSVSAIIPPWGGEFTIDILPLLDWDKLRNLPPKWILGYSDISTLCFVYTLLTGSATAHGVNYVDLRAPKWDTLTGRWAEVLAIPFGSTIKQVSSEYYQSSWEKAFQDKHSGYHLDTPTVWKTLDSFAQREKITMSGRLLGGCVETLVSLAGTRFAPIPSFIREYAPEGVLWYLECCESSAAQLYRALWTMRENGWFEHANGVLFGRMTSSYRDTEDFTYIDALNEIFTSNQIPVVYDTDIGHVPPQLIMVNGAQAEVTVQDGKAICEMTFR
ncbi:S66 family peptidase [Risungbinella massiliensis]|uniref:S66 family peptidase n=1 Tax=Risungbinella massiliensis TaxID=1329796 RepID=UPI0005CC4894|nr:S66 peptidase family protein [Risungbinella massiliensis]